MSEYLLILLWIGLCAFFARYVKVTKTELVCCVEEERYHWLFAFIMFLPIILMAGFRDRWFADTSLYVYEYLKMPNTFSEIPSFLEQFSKDKGFSVLSILIKMIIGNNYRSYLIIIAAFQGAVVFSFFRKYSFHYVFSVFLFVVSTDYISWMFNGIRQFLAVVIVLCATPFLLKKKWIPLLIVILLASTVHQSALIMIPIVLIAQGKAWNKKTLLFIGVVLIAILFLDVFTNVLDESLQNTQYKNVVKDYTEWNDDGTNPIRVFVYAIPTIISLLGRKQIENSGSSLVNICVNLSIISTGIYIVSIFTSGIFLGRLPIYISLFNYILLPWEINHIIPFKYKNVFIVSIISMYIIFYYYQMHIAWSLI